MTRKKVFITGISGWIAQYCAIELLQNGYTVKGSLRNMNRQQEVIEALSKHVDTKDKLEFCQLDLLIDDGWDDAMIGCEYLMHIASPFIMTEPKNEDDLIKPAKEGTLRALKSAQKAGVKRVVLTSSIAAMCAHMLSGTFTPESWTNINQRKKINTYQKSKTVAEKAAWDFIENLEDKNSMELSVINPGGVLGPALSDDIQGASLDICYQLLTKKMPGIPDFRIVFVDVRDVAKHHFLAMTLPEAKNKRFISAYSTPTSFLKLATTLKENGFDVPTNKVPTLLLKCLSYFSPQTKFMLPLLGRYIDCDNSATINTFKWKPTPLEKTFVDMATSVQDVLNKKK